MHLQGKAHKYGDNIDTDVIIPARYLTTNEPKELAKHCMEYIDKDFISKVKPGDFIVVGENFGCGSSREHAPIAIKASGIAAVIAKSFARIFYRNAINIGLPILESPEAATDLNDGDYVEIDTNSGTIKCKGKTYQTKPFPKFILNIINAGGLMNYVKKRLKGVD